MDDEKHRNLRERLLAFVGNLRFPWIFLIMAVVFVVDLLVPDMLPFVDEILLGLATVLLASWKKRKGERLTDTAEEPREPRKLGARETEMEP